MASVTLRGLTKTFDGGASLALQELSLEVRDREFLVLLGPSGCGKTTALRLIAGLDSPSAGEIRIGDRPVNALSPKDRDVAMVFQNYALYPHMSVFDKMAFGLKVRKLPHPEALLQRPRHPCRGRAVYRHRGFLAPLAPRPRRRSRAPRRPGRGRRGAARGSDDDTRGRRRSDVAPRGGGRDRAARERKAA